MPFDPLPPSFVELLKRRRADDVPVVELGCGDGRFGALVKSAGAPVWGLDVRSPRFGSTACFVGDARRPPVRAECLPLIVAANLVRHLAVREPRLGFLAAWVSLLRPSGAVYVFEDDAASASPAARNYGKLQAFLAELMPLDRGPLLPADAVEKVWSPGCGWRVEDGGRRANAWPCAREPVLAMLRGDGGRPAPRVGRLRSAIERDGIEPGAYWWRRLVTE